MIVFRNNEQFSTNNMCTYDIKLKIPREHIRDHSVVLLLTLASFICKIFVHVSDLLSVCLKFCKFFYFIFNLYICYTFLHQPMAWLYPFLDPFKAKYLLTENNMHP